MVPDGPIGSPIREVRGPIPSYPGATRLDERDHRFPASGSCRPPRGLEALLEARSEPSRQPRPSSRPWRFGAPVPKSARRFRASDQDNSPAATATVEPEDRRGHGPTTRQPTTEPSHFGFAHLPWMPPVVMDDERSNPVNVCLFRPWTVVPRSNRIDGIGSRQIADHDASSSEVTLR